MYQEAKKEPKEKEEEEEKTVNHSQNDDVCLANDDSSSNKEVKSTAVVKFSAVQSPVLFFKLRSNTDLNRPPENWLRESDRCQVLKAHSAPPSTKTDSPMFPSLQMASEFPDCVGEVDVVSNSEIIKKLLKMPYSNSQVSMMVHRVGKTLFLDEFDINMYLLRAAKKEWEWLRKFYVENVLQSLNLQQKQKNFFRKNRSRDYLQHKNMLSKFLYHSVADVPATSPIERNEPSNDPRTAGNTSTRSYVDGNKLSAQNECKPLIDDVEEEDQELNEDVDHNFQRNVLWTFEDIRMLIGTDMPIFGAGTHPCVSLKLRDITKPINILTGLDYWLDNLMCNVPEVMMCYHLDGIVQKYELIKTEDLPQLENSNFSPKVIKDIAQNVLSFLKSKATKAGHTYWLFKAKDNEVVKLYDLTTLCSSAVDEVEEEQNPFTMPLAMLLYRLASKMKACGPKKSQLATIVMLLQNCLALLDSKKHPQIAMSTHYHLSDLYIPDTLDLSSPNLSPGTTDDEEEDYEDEMNEEEEEENVEAVEENASSSSSVEIKTLCLPNMLDSRACTSDDNACRYPLLPASLEERCQAAIHHAQDGLACLEMASENKQSDDDNEARTSSSSLTTSPLSKTSHRYQASNSKEEVQARAKPFIPIPLHYEPIKKSNADSDETLPEKMCLTSTRKFGEWEIRKARRLLQKGALAAYVFAFRLYGCSKAGTALRYTDLALRCYDAMERLSYGGRRAQPNLLASYILLLAGDVHFLLIQNASHLNEYQQEYNDFSDFEGLFNSTRELNGEFSFEWAISFHTKLEDNLLCSVRCYEAALERACGELDRVKLRKRLGNIKNELGVFYLNQAHNMYMETGELSTELENLWKISYECLQSGIQFFEGMDDDVNAALLNSNLGRLMRTRAHCYTPPKDAPKEFSTKEGNFYEKAITYYRKSLRILGDSPEYASIRESVSWELSTTYFTMATLLQDFAPLSTKPQEEVEKEISELMQKALKCIDLERPTVRQPIYQYRAASIYHRLGSLYHHSYRHSSSDENRKKQQRTLGEMYLGKALGLFQLLEDVAKSLEVQLERIGMWEFHIQSLIGISAKVQNLHKLLEAAFEMIPILTVLAEKFNLASDSKVCTIDLNSSTNSNTDDFATYVDLLTLLQQRLQFCLLNLVKVNAGKPTSKKGQQLQTNNSQTLQTYKRMYNEALQLSVPTKDNVNVENLIKTILQIRELYSGLAVKH